MVLIFKLLQQLKQKNVWNKNAKNNELLFIEINSKKKLITQNIDSNKKNIDNKGH